MRAMDGAFHGTKAVLAVGDRLVLLRRDDLPGLPHAGRVDLPGGGREGDESAVACTAREVAEETGLRLAEARFGWGRAYGDGRVSWLFAAEITEAEAAGLRLGDEGQALWTEGVEAYLARTDAIPHQQARVADWWAERSGGCHSVAGKAPGG